MDSGEFINLLFWNTYSLTKLAGFKFPVADYCVQRFLGFGGAGVAAEDAGEQLDVQRAGAFAWLLSGVRIRALPISGHRMIPNALRGLPWQKKSSVGPSTKLFSAGN